MAAERRRHVVALGAAVLLGVPLAVLLGAADGSAGGLAAVGVLLVLDVWCLVYTAATLRTFAAMGPDALREVVARHPRGTTLRILRGGSDGPFIAVQFAGLALVAATVLPRINEFAPDGRERVVLVVLSAVGVIAGWAVLTVSYAVHYARLDVRHDGLRFPGEDRAGFTDYIYFAVAVAVTFGTTDVEVAHRGMRRVVTIHAVLGFVYNAVILALLITVL